MSTIVLPERGRLQYKTYNGNNDWRQGAAKAYGEEHGYSGAQGGWIYSPNGRTITQGWGSFYSIKRTAILDWITRRITGAASFQDLLCTQGTYRPTILICRGIKDGWMYEALAEAYDDAQRERGDRRRAHRGRGYFKVGYSRGGTFLHPVHVVNGEHEGDGRALCGRSFESSWGDLTPARASKVNCRQCRELAGLPTSGT